MGSATWGSVGVFLMYRVILLWSDKGECSYTEGLQVCNAVVHSAVAKRRAVSVETKGVSSKPTVGDVQTQCTTQLQQLLPVSVDGFVKVVPVLV